MLEYEFLKAVGDLIPTLQAFPLPVVAVDLEFTAHWSNEPARMRYAHLAEPGGLRAALEQFELDALRGMALEKGRCMVGEVFPMSPLQISLTPLYAEREPVGLLAALMDRDMAPGSGFPDFTAGASKTLAEGLRRAVGEVFDAMDTAAFKADLMDVGWMKHSLVQAEYYGYRILRAADNVAEYAALQSGEAVLRLEAVDLAGLLRELSGPVQALAAGAGIPVQFRLPEEPVSVQLDRARFDLILFNLLHNAMYFTKPGNEIFLEAVAGSGGIGITVADKGLGIPDEVQAKVFQPFFSYVHDKGIPTTGMGLTLAKRLAEAHGGKLRLSSQMGEGTTVSFWLPGGGFSAAVPLKQDVGRDSLRDRFSRLYTGLGDVAASPYRPVEEDD